MEDRYEAYATYTIIAVFLILAVAGYFCKDMSETTVITLCVFVAVLSGNRDLLDYLLRR